MCDADVSYASFHHNPGDDYNIFPDLKATHTCRDFEAIKGWAMSNQANDWHVPGKESVFMGLPDMPPPSKNMVSAGRSL
jgi:hypothetical protein